MKRKYFFIELFFFGFVKKGLIARVYYAIFLNKAWLRREEMLQQAEVRLSLSLSLSTRISDCCILLIHFRPQ